MSTASRGASTFMCLTTLLCSLVTLAGAGCGLDPAKFGAGILVPAEATPETAGLERAMHARLNRDRAKQGLQPLAFDPELAAVARAHAEERSRAHAEDSGWDRFFARLAAHGHARRPPGQGGVSRERGAREPG